MAILKKKCCHLSDYSGADSDADSDADIFPINTPDSPCYDDQAENGEVACFSWAAWRGPCTAVANACMNDEVCVILETCYVDSWRNDNWEEIQAQCELESGGADSDAVQKFWTYRQCIYCDARDMACLPDSGAMRCDEYTGEGVTEFIE